MRERETSDSVPIPPTLFLYFRGLPQFLLLIVVTVRYIPLELASKLAFIRVIYL